MSPYKRVGKTVYKKTSHGLVKKGSSKSASKAKAYMKALYVHSKDTRGTGTKTRKGK